MPGLQVCCLPLRLRARREPPYDHQGGASYCLLSLDTLCASQLTLVFQLSRRASLNFTRKCFSASSSVFPSARESWTNSTHSRVTLRDLALSVTKSILKPNGMLNSLCTQTPKPDGPPIDSNVRCLKSVMWPSGDALVRPVACHPLLQLSQTEDVGRKHLHNVQGTDCTEACV